MSLQQTVSSYAGTAISGTGFAGFLAAADPYMKAGFAVLTALAAITTIAVNILKWRQLRASKSSD